MNKLVLGITTVLMLPSVLADGWDMMGGSGMMGAGGLMLGGFYSLIYLAVISFIFSIIFWWTYTWIVKEKKR